MLLSEILGVERDTDFGVEEYVLKFKVVLDRRGVECLVFVLEGISGWRLADSITLCDIINLAPAGIIHLPPPLTDEQREQLRHIYGLGGRYLAKDASGIVFCYQARPEKEDIEWTVRDPNDEFMEITYFVPTVVSLVSWSDPEPYDIGKALGWKNE